MRVYRATEEFTEFEYRIRRSLCTIFTDLSSVCSAVRRRFESVCRLCKIHKSCHHRRSREWCHRTEAAYVRRPAADEHRLVVECSHRTLFDNWSDPMKDIFVQVYMRQPADRLAGVIRCRSSIAAALVRAPPFMFSMLLIRRARHGRARMCVRVRVHALAASSISGMC